MPPYHMTQSVDFHQTSFTAAPHKFEAGPPDISGPVAMGAAMDYLDCIGLEHNWQHDHDWQATLTNGFQN